MSDLPTQAACLIAIVGGSCSGKTLFARRLADALAPPVPLTLAEDDYYQDFAARPGFTPHGFNFDEPAALDHAMLADHLAGLRLGGSVTVPRYDFRRHGRVGTVTVDPSVTVLVEGRMLLADPGLRRLFDHSIFLDLPADVRLERRVRRDCAERGRSERFVRTQFAETVQPMHSLHIEPTRRYASDVVTLSGGAGDLSALEAAIDRALAVVAACTALPIEAARD